MANYYLHQEIHFSHKEIRHEMYNTIIYLKFKYFSSIIYQKNMQLL